VLYDSRTIVYSNPDVVVLSIEGLKVLWGIHATREFKLAAAKELDSNRLADSELVDRGHIEPDSKNKCSWHRRKF
jgi:hypothetical protein